MQDRNSTLHSDYSSVAAEGKNSLALVNVPPEEWAAKSPFLCLLPLQFTFFSNLPLVKKEQDLMIIIYICRLVV